MNGKDTVNEVITVISTAMYFMMSTSLFLHQAISHELEDPGDAIHVGRPLLSRLPGPHCSRYEQNRGAVNTKTLGSSLHTYLAIGVIKYQ